MQDEVFIKGGKNYKGSVEISASKHCSLAILGAILLAKGKVKLKNPPNITDFNNFLKIYEGFGCRIKKDNKGSIIFDSTNFRYSDPDPKLVKNFRAAVLLSASTLLRSGYVCFPMPEGDWPGSRKTSSTLNVLGQFDVTTKYDGARIRAFIKRFGNDRIHENRLILVNSKVFATFLAMILAVGFGGVTEILDPLSSPEVDNLKIFLEKIGASISGLDSKKMIIKSPGLKNLNPTNVQLTIFPDVCETVFWMSFTGITESKIKLIFPFWESSISSKEVASLYSFGNKIKKIGLKMNFKDNKQMEVECDSRKKLKSIDILPPFHDKKGQPRDASPQLVPLFASLRGVSYFLDDKYLRNRISWMKELNKMDADIKLHGNLAVISGINKSLKGGDLVGKDIRAAASLLLAALGAKGESHLKGVKHINRSYTNLISKLKQVGCSLD